VPQRFAARPSVTERRALIERVLAAPVRSLELIDVGYDSEVAVVDGEWIFRFPRRAQVERWLETEIALLPELAPSLPVEVPRFEYVAREPVMYVGYRMIKGEALTADVSARRVADFLAALHAFDVSRAEALGVPRPDWRAHYEEQCDEFERVVFPLLEPAERRDAKRMFAAGIELLSETETALIHADLGPEHMLCRDRELVGVIDWGDVRIGDPALDYAWLLNGMPPEFAAALDAERFRERSLFHHRLGPWYEAHYGVFVGRPQHVEAGVRGIRERL
jgi:aminoglycoside phosphotransferase (APT) family kinase protein